MLTFYHPFSNYSCYNVITKSSSSNSSYMNKTLWSFCSLNHKHEILELFVCGLCEQVYHHMDLVNLWLITFNTTSGRRSLKVRDQLTFLTPQLTSKFLRFWYQQMAHIFLINILKFGVPKLGIYEEIIKNVLTKQQKVVITLNKTIKRHFLLLLQNKKEIYSFFTLDEPLK